MRGGDNDISDTIFELPALEAQLEQGDTLATLESVKAVSDVYAPISGKVVEVNKGLEDSPETVNEDPHGKGWLVVIEVASPAQVDSLLDAAAYEKYLSSE
jgi:glycine cleavage system H protein